MYFAVSRTPDSRSYTQHTCSIFARLSHSPARARHTSLRCTPARLPHEHTRRAHLCRPTLARPLAADAEGLVSPVISRYGGSISEMEIVMATERRTDGEGDRAGWRGR